MHASIAGQENREAKGPLARFALWLSGSRGRFWLAVPLIGLALGLALYVAFTLRREGHDSILLALLASGCGFAFLLTAFMAGRQRNEAALRSIVLRLRRQNAALSYLSRHNAINGSDLHLELQALTARSAEILRTERVSVWLLNDEQNELVCQCLYQRSSREFSSGFSLKASDYPRYFATLHDGRGFAADDAQNDPRTNEFTAGYLRPLGIGAMLDVPIRIDNRLAGVVCHEHVGSVRHWHDDEQNFAASIGDLASLAYESVRRHEAEKLLQQANAELEDKVAARTEELRAANERLREMDVLKSRYLSSISEQLERTVADIDHVKQHDVLTNLPNRVFFNDLLEQALASGQRVAVLLVDLDSFKVINDSLGHVCGDELLVVLSERIVQCLNEGDQVARIGSDEFAVLFCHMLDREQVAQFAQRLLFTLAAPSAIGPEPLSVTASIGIAISPDDGSDRHALIKAADTAVFSAKGQGRNRYCFHTPEMSARASELHSIEQGLKRALEENHLSVHYQPQVFLASGELAGLEALVRWNHPVQGMRTFHPGGRGLWPDCRTGALGTACRLPRVRAVDAGDAASCASGGQCIGPPAC